jgi:alpha-mannosidase
LQTGNGFNYAGDFNSQGLNSYWYVPGLNPADAVTNGKVQTTVVEQGPVVTTLTMSAAAPGARQLKRSISLFTNGEQVEIENTLDKMAIRKKEGVHFGFPFNSLFNKTTLDAGYGTMQFMADQLPGSNMDYLYGRRWVDVSAAEKGVQLMLLQAPLVEPGNMIDERQTVQQSHKEWKKTGSPTATWFSYVMNNYWHTNYKADQGGISHFKYALRPHGMVNGIEMEQAAAAFTQPLIALPVKEGTLLPGQLFELTNSRLVVTSITPQQDGAFIIRLFNPEYSAQQTQFNWKSLQPGSFIDKTSGEIKSNTAEVKLAAMGVSEFLLKK